MPPINGQQPHDPPGPVHPPVFQSQPPRFPPGVIKPQDPRQQQPPVAPGTKITQDQPQLNDQRQPPVNANQPSHLNALPYSSNQQYLPPQQQQQNNNFSQGLNNQAGSLQYSRPPNPNPPPSASLFNKNQGQNLPTVPLVPNSQFNLNSNVNPNLVMGPPRPTLPTAQFSNNQQHQLQQQQPPIPKQQLNYGNQQMDPRLPPTSSTAPIYPTQNYGLSQQNLTSQKRYPPANFNPVPSAGGITSPTNDNLPRSGPPLPGQVVRFINNNN